MMYEVQQFVAVDGDVLRAPQQRVDIDGLAVLVRFLDMPYCGHKFSSEKFAQFVRQYGLHP